MQTNFSFKNTRNSNNPLQHNPNFKSSTTWMDQRVLQIMEKYQKPTKRDSIHTPQRYGKGLSQNQKPNVWEHLRINTQDISMTPLREQNFNIDRDLRQNKTNWREQKPYYQNQYKGQIARTSQNIYSQMFYKDEISPTLSKQNYNKYQERQTYLHSRDNGKKSQEEEKIYIPRKCSYNKPLNTTQSYKCQYPLQQKQHFNCKSSFMERKSYSPYNKAKKCQQSISKFQFENQISNKKSTNRSITEYYDNYQADKKIKNFSDPRGYDYLQTNPITQNDRNEVLYDQRITNIERINQKIKSILNNHDQFEKKSQKKHHKQERYSLTPTKLRIRTDFDELLIKNEANLEQKRQKSTSNLQVSLKVDQSMQNRDKKETSVKKQKGKNQDKAKLEIKISQEEKERPRSCLNKKDKNIVNRSDTQNEQKYKKIQDQMEKYQNRIAQHTEQKKKMNFKFEDNNSILKQVSYQNLQTKKNERGFYKNKQDKQTDSKLIKANLSVNLTKQNNSGNNANKGEKNNILHPTNQLDAYQQSKESNIVQKEQLFQQAQSMIQKNQPQYFNFSSKNGLIESQLYDGLQLNTQINLPKYYNIESQSQISLSLVETKQFLKTLSDQVKLDEQFRITKTWFVNSDIYNQFEVLQSIIGQRWKQMSLEVIQQQFSVNFEQDDPFYSYRADQFALQDMVNNYILCSKHWKENIQHQWNTIKLIEQGLVDKLDLQNKGYIAIQDLVRILNMEEGTFYRNRDLYMIYQRMIHQYSEEGNEYLSIDAFNTILCQK